jgi:hypothetical protein
MNKVVHYAVAGIAAAGLLALAACGGGSGGTAGTDRSDSCGDQAACPLISGGTDSGGNSPARPRPTAARSHALPRGRRSRAAASRGTRRFRNAREHRPSTAEPRNRMTSALRNHCPVPLRLHIELGQPRLGIDASL